MTIKVNGVELSDRTISYLETILWAETVTLPMPENDLVNGCMNVDANHVLHDIPDGEPLEDYFDIEDFTKESLQKAKDDVEGFFDRVDCADLAEDTADYKDDNSVAHDFWLTRNSHGAGFWDGDYGDELGDALTDIAKGYPGQHIFIDDDEGQLHLEG